jgi:hypothetical protein
MAFVTRHTVEVASLIHPNCALDWTPGTSSPSPNSSSGCSKIGGRLGLSFVAVVHHLSDVLDGAAAKEASAILRMASTRTIHRAEIERGPHHRPGARPSPVGARDHPHPHARHRRTGRERQRPGRQTPRHRARARVGLHRPRHVSASHVTEVSALPADAYTVHDLCD